MRYPPLIGRPARDLHAAVFRFARLTFALGVLVGLIVGMVTAVVLR